MKFLALSLALAGPAMADFYFGIQSGTETVRRIVTILPTHALTISLPQPGTVDSTVSGKGGEDGTSGQCGYVVAPSDTDICSGKFPPGQHGLSYLLTSCPSAIATSGITPADNSGGCPGQAFDWPVQFDIHFFDPLQKRGLSNLGTGLLWH